MIYAQPGSTFTATTAPGTFATGLAGTLGVRIENGDGTNHTVRTTTGIVELEPLSSAYAKDDLVAPTTAGLYIVLWDDGTVFASEELTVTSTAPTPPLPVANEYVTLAELKATLELTGETFADTDIQTALTAASRGIDNHTDRRFWADADVNQVRYYTPESSWQVWIDDLVTLTALDTDRDGNGTFAESWTVNTDFTLEPMNAPADGRPYRSIRVHSRSSLYLPVDWSRSVRVTGRFGWASVPVPVKEATVIVASKLLKRAREAPFGVVGIGMDGAAVQIIRSDPDLQFLLEPYQRFVT